MHQLAGTPAHQPLDAEREVRWRCPGLLSEADRALVARQAVEIRAEVAGEALQPVEPPDGLEGLRVQFERRVRRVDAGAAAGSLLGAARVRRAVGAEEELCDAGGRSLEECHA